MPFQELLHLVQFDWSSGGPCCHDGEHAGGGGRREEGQGQAIALGGRLRARLQGGRRTEAAGGSAAAATE